MVLISPFIFCGYGNSNKKLRNGEGFLSCSSKSGKILILVFIGQPWHVFSAAIWLESFGWPWKVFFRKCENPGVNSKLSLHTTPPTPPPPRCTALPLVPLVFYLLWHSGYRKLDNQASEGLRRNLRWSKTGGKGSLGGRLWNCHCGYSVNR